MFADCQEYSVVPSCLADFECEFLLLPGVDAHLRSVKTPLCRLVLKTYDILRSVVLQ